MLALALTVLLTTLPAANLPRLHISPDGHSFTANGKHFFWLGDTAWSLFAKLDLPEAKRYFATRRAQGFNVIQAHILDGQFDAPETGDSRAFLNNDFLEPNEAYWRHADQLIDEAARHGLYLALLPAWARSYTEAKNARLTDPATARRYGLWLGQRYRHRTHLVWILGGDVKPTRHAVYDALAEGLREGAGPHTLISYHPPGGTNRPPASSTGEWYHGKPWLSFNLIQSGHRVGNRNFERIAEDYARLPAKPTLDSEPCYEGHPIQHKFENGEFRAHHLRQRAYWSVLAGAAGFTYGANGVWQMDKPGAIFKASHHNRFWYDALNLPGAQQMRHLRTLFGQQAWTPSPQLIAESAEPLQAARSSRGRAWLVYFPTGRAATLQLPGLVRARWFNPRNGQSAAATKHPAGPTTFQPPGAPGDDNDWVLLLERR
jgi:hypothetical protein